METLKPVSLLLVRHGQAQSNVSRILTSYPEANPMSLSPRGRKEAEAAAHALAAHSVAALFASPLTRTQETAGIISAKIQVPVQTDLRLRETDFGSYNNKSSAKFFFRYPHPSLRNTTSEESGVEGLKHVQVRIKEFLREIRERYAGQTVVVVTHSDIIHELLGIIEGTGRHMTPIATGGVYPAVLDESTRLE